MIMQADYTRLADPARARRENVPGAFFVDDACISCGACWNIAPDLIVSHPVHTYAFFGRQPAGERETELARAALQTCPVGAIGEAGERHEREL